MRSDLKKRKRKFVRDVVEWARDHLREFEWRKGVSPYEIFVAEVMLKRTTSTAARRAYLQFLKRFPDVRSIARSRRQTIEKYLRPVGLYKQRSKGLKEAASYIMDNYGGSLPDAYEELITVPHIGPYTAGAITSFGFNKPAPIVDSNVKRVTQRVFSDLFGDGTATDKKIGCFLREVVPEKDHKLFNWGLIDLGALICSYQFQKHEECPLSGVCAFFERQMSKKE